MNSITDPRICAYLHGLHPEKDSRLLAMEEKARVLNFPVIDRLAATLLQLLTRLKPPKLVAELGWASAIRHCGLLAR